LAALAEVRQRVVQILIGAASAGLRLAQPAALDAFVIEKPAIGWDSAVPLVLLKQIEETLPQGSNFGIALGGAVSYI